MTDTKNTAEAPGGGAGRILDIRFDGPPGHQSGRFVEVEIDGAGVGVGEWVEDGSDWLLRIPSIVVLNAERREDQPKLALAFAVAQEAALLLDSIDRNGITGLDLSTYSRLRTTAESWMQACGFSAEDLDRWLDQLSTTELAPGVPVTATGTGERRLALVVQGRGAEVADEIERLATVPPAAGIYREDGGRAVVRVLQDASNEKEQCYRLRIVRVLDQPRIGPRWMEGEEFEVDKVRDAPANLLIWSLGQPRPEDLEGISPEAWETAS